MATLSDLLVLFGNTPSLDFKGLREYLKQLMRVVAAVMRQSYAHKDFSTRAADSVILLVD